MCRLIESIRLSHKTLENLPYHEQRMNQARAALFGETEPIRLSSQINIPPHLDDGIYKCRVLYKEQVEHVAFTPYQPRAIHTLKLLHDNTLDYGFKYENRQDLNSLFVQRNGCDDVLIVKNGYITDTSYSNIAFYDGKEWITPSTPLLKGTQRQKLLDEKVIIQQDIRIDALHKFQYARLINALLCFEAPTIPVSQIY